MLAQVHIDARRSDRALEILDETLARVQRSGALVEEPELRRLKAEVILKCDSSSTAEAEAWYREAIATARKQSSKWWELRATVSLARLLRDNNRLDEARTKLADIYNWFTEGFDTADLKDAKTLLAELSA
jgi:predicted ATPase